MRPSVRLTVGWVLLALALPVGVVFAQVAKLDEAVRLYEQARYTDAQRALMAIDVSTLGPAERAEYDRLKNSLDTTLAGVRKADTDFAAAEDAFRAQRWSDAETHYSAVIENTLAPTALRDQAMAKRAQVRQRMSGGSAGSMQPMHSMGGAPRSTPAPAPAAQPSRGPVGQMQPMTPIGVPQAQPRTVYSRPAPPPPPAPAPAPRPAQPAGPMTPMSPASPSELPPPAPRSAVQIASPSAQNTPVDEMRARDELLWQRAESLLNSLSTTARTAMADRDFETARQAAEQALQEVEAARAFAEPVSRYQSARERALSLRREVEDAAETYGITRAEEQRAEIAELLHARTEAIERQRQEKIEQLFATADQLRKEQRFAEEAEVYRQVLYTDPGNSLAKAKLEVAEDYASFFSQRDWHDQLQFQQRRALSNVDEVLIPYDYEVMYPRNWPEIAARREAIGPGVTGQSPEDIELNRKLDQKLPEVRFQGQAFEAVIDYLQTQTDINFSVDWEDLEAQGVQRDREVTIGVRDVDARTVLTELLTQVGGDVRLAFAVGDGLLRIATKEKLDRDKFVLVYDIRDLLVNIPRFNNAAQLDPGQALQQAAQAGAQVGGGLGGGGGGGAAGGGGQLFQGGQAGGRQENADQDALVEEIIDIIRQTVEPDSWRDVGGGDASIRELNGQLIIYNTSDSHRQVQNLLGQLRETRALQIALEARYLNVTSNFLEEIGVDLDFVFNSGSAGFDRAFAGNGQAIVDPFTGAPVLIPRQFSQAGVLPALPGFGTPFTAGPVPVQPYGQAGLVPQAGGLSPNWSSTTPITMQQGSLALTDPANFNTQVPGSFAGRAAQPALNIAGSILDNLQVDFLIRATQANGRSSIVQAPRILMFNGQRANITVGRARTYVASLSPILAEGAVGFAPVPGVAQSGVVLDVEGTISADRKYVTVTVQTTQSEEPDLQRFEVQRQSGNSPGSFITLIDQRFVTINTTVSIPDGGTILLGGLKQAGEIEVEAGVPILSKIPILKRAFTNSTVLKDTRTLLILMKAKILIQKEQEEEAFPTFASQGA
jgi:general secretion pathway protein D